MKFVNKERNKNKNVNELVFFNNYIIKNGVSDNI